MTTRRRKSGCLFFIVLIAVCVIAYFTNPTKLQHQTVAKERLSKVADDLLAKYGVEKGLLGVFGKDLTGQLVDELVQTHVSSDNYFLLSTTQVNWDGRSQIIGIGAFNNVFIPKKVDEILEREVEKYVKEKIQNMQIPGLDLKDFGFDLEL
ncbi:MAG: DUF4359 domain-containing protein [Paludibacteraceae bacterium]